jgi:hypothetical protein
LPEASYDAVVAAGVLTHGHAPPEALDGILKIARSGAAIVFSLSLIAFEEHGFKQKIEGFVPTPFPTRKRIYVTG